MKHRPFHKLEVNATNKIQLDHYFQLLTGLPASTLSSLKYDLVGGAGAGGVYLTTLPSHS